MGPSWCSILSAIVSSSSGDESDRATPRALRTRTFRVVAFGLVTLLAACNMPHVPSAPDTDPAASEPEILAEPLIALLVANVTVVESAGAARIPVSLSRAAAEAVNVPYATRDGDAVAGDDYEAAAGTLTFAANSTVAQHVEVLLRDDQVAEPTEVFAVRFGSPEGAAPDAVSATATIIDDDTREVRVAPRNLYVPEGGSANYRVTLGAPPNGPVTVALSAASAELTLTPDRLVFAPARWPEAMTVTVTAATDADAAADAPVLVTHTARGGGYDGTAAQVRVTIIEKDTATLAVTAARASEGAGSLEFEVTLSLAGAGAITAEYATRAVGDTATEGEDYARTIGTLRFPAGATAAQTVAVTVLDDRLDELDEQLTLTLRNANALLASGEDTMAATGTIEDDDTPSVLSMTDVQVDEEAGDGLMRFVVSLEPVSGRTVTMNYATTAGTASAQVDYTSVDGTLTFVAGSTAQTIAVPIVDDDEFEDDETLTVSLSAVQGATVAVATATGTVTDMSDRPQLELNLLQVTGGGTMYPAFAPGIRHYALTCDSAETELQVTATAARSSATLTLLREDSTQEVAATGSLSTSLKAGRDHDVAIRLTDTDGTVTYVVHCVASPFPNIRILEKTDQATDGLLLLTPTQKVDGIRYTHMAVVDYNGVPRFHRAVSHGRNFRRYEDSPEINGKRVRYSMSETYNPGHVNLFDADLALIATRTTVSPLTRTNSHDFLFNGTDSMLLMSYEPFTEDFTGFTDENGDPVPGGRTRALDSVIQEVSLDGSELFRWHAWDYLKHADCRFINVGDYTHINSMQLKDGDIIASFRNCSTVVRIDRSTGDVVWTLGGTSPARDSDTEFLEIVGDHAGGFCGQHTPILTESDTIVMFDNGVYCHPERETEVRSRAVEYDISSGTQAVFVREYQRPAGQGLSMATGGVVILDNGHWLISWGSTSQRTVSLDKYIAVTEYDPATSTPHFHLHMSQFDESLPTYRVYWLSETDVTIPLNLP